MKLVLHPVLMFLLLSLFGPFDQTWVYTAVLMAALPPALNVFVFARQYDTWVEQASSAVLVGTLVSVVTLTSVMWMVKTGTLPPCCFGEIMQPLSGLLVLDFTTLLPGPLATLMLAEAGAEVIKIERPGGEDMRRFPPVVDGESAPSRCSIAARKVSRSISRTAADRAKLMPLIKRADILIEQFRPGVMARLGFGYDDVRALNPRLIYCSISGYGQSGPRADEAGHDINYIGNTGLLDLQPGPIEAPVVPPMLVADIAGGSFPAVINILLALRARDQSGQGCHLDIAMTDAMFTFAWYALALGAATGRFPRRARCGWWAARRAISFIRPRTASSSPAAPSSRNSGWRSPRRLDWRRSSSTMPRDPESHARRGGEADRCANGGRMAADFCRRRLLRHHRGAAARGDARSAFRRARIVRARGCQRVGQDLAGAAAADRAAISRPAGREEGAEAKLVHSGGQRRSRGSAAPMTGSAREPETQTRAILRPSLGPGGQGPRKPTQNKPRVRGNPGSVRRPGNYNASPRIRRGCAAAGATPSRISARRSGPMRSMR